MTLDHLKQMNEKKHRIIIPKISEPNSGIRFLDVLVRRWAYSGDTIIVKTVSGKKSVPGVSLTLKSLDTLKIAGKAKTNKQGIALFKTPEVDRPQIFYFEVKKEGFAYYWPKDDWRTDFQGTGFYPIASMAVYPMMFQDAPQPLEEKPKPKFEIDVAFGWTTMLRFPSFGVLIEKAANKGYEADEDWWAGDGTIFDHMEEKGSNDVWIYVGHTDDADGDTSTAESITGWRPGAVIFDYTSITPEQLCEHIKKNPPAPGIVFLGGCSSASLLQALVDCCVKIAIGFTNTIPSITMANALIKFWEALLDGKTLEEATKEANDWLNGLSSESNPQGATITWKAKPHIEKPGKKKLDELRKLPSKI